MLFSTVKRIFTLLIFFTLSSTSWAEDISVQILSDVKATRYELAHYISNLYGISQLTRCQVRTGPLRLDLKESSSKDVSKKFGFVLFTIVGSSEPFSVELQSSTGQRTPSGEFSILKGETSRQFESDIAREVSDFLKEKNIQFKESPKVTSRPPLVMAASDWIKIADPKVTDLVENDICARFALEAAKLSRGCPEIFELKFFIFP